MKKVCVVIVLYKNSNEFRKCLESLEAQSIEIDYYIFIDNSDEELSKLNREVISEKELSKSRFTYVMCKENRGSAFGFALGMWIADQCGFDLIWLNDQDGAADVHCLENIMKCYAADREEVGIYVPNVCDLKTKKELAGFHTHVNGFLHSGLSGDKKINSFGTSGVCMTRETVRRIGYYNYKVCYVGNEDKEYALRARKNNLKIKYIKNAVYYHPDTFEKYKRKRKIKRYYLLQYIIPLNMGLIMEHQKNDLRHCKACESSAYLNDKYANFICKYINYVYCVFMAVANRSCDVKATMDAYKKGRQLARKEEEMMYIKRDLQEFYLNMSQ